jgi:hypothetical protein
MAITNTEEINRDTVYEHQNVGDDINKSSRRLEITEHYIRMDYEGNGKACLYRVTTGGGETGGGGTGDILKRDGQDDIIEFDAVPFAAMTPVIVTHRFFGRSIADLVMDIQRIKTALLRSLLDNTYLANNPRVVVAESLANENTLDDLLVSRQGGIVRAKAPNAIEWQEVPTIGNHVYPALEYMDTMREMRTGVTKQGTSLDADALQNQSATATNIMFTMAQARMRLVARIFAETGIKDLFLLLHGLIRKHGQQAQTVRLRNTWVNVDPRDWKKRNDMAVEVGLGTGGKAEQMALINMIGAAQEKMLVGGLTNIVTPANLYNSAKVLTRIAGHKDVNAFFTDPTGQPPPQQQPDPKLQIEMIKQQSLDKKAQADLAHQQWKGQADAALEQQKFEHDRQLAVLEAQLQHNDQQHQHAIAERKAQMDEYVAIRKLEIEAAKAAMKPSPEDKQAQKEAPLKAITASHQQMAAKQDELHQHLHHAIQGVTAHITAPVEFIRDAKGKLVGAKRNGQHLNIHRGADGKIAAITPQ